ncbi:MAG TPA: glycoside hydrolase family 20 zincin-like fold domain-containing protein, partial [Steroidobacteraceae bacterium]
MKVETGFLTRALALICLTMSAAHGASVHLKYDASSPQASYAARKLSASLSELGHTLPDDPAKSNYRIDLSIRPKRLAAESFSISADANRISIEGGDSRGLIYGALALREQLLNGTPLEKIATARETPALPFRGIKFNTPWDTYRPSSALDQHYATARDLKFWEAWLDMMVENRFNAFTLWTMHPFTYMVRPKNFPEAGKWSDAEFAEWQHLYREIFRMAKERGLDTYIVFWSIFVSEEFAKAHNVAGKNFYPHY